MTKNKNQSNFVGFLGGGLLGGPAGSAFGVGLGFSSGVIHSSGMTGLTTCLLGTGSVCGLTFGISLGLVYGLGRVIVLIWRYWFEY